jgi:TonB family protein
MMKTKLTRKTLGTLVLILGVLSLTTTVQAQSRTSPKSRYATASTHTEQLDPRKLWQDGVNPRELGQPIQAQHQSVRSCYESQLKRTPSLEGSIDVRFKITHWGRVGKTKVTNNKLSNRRVRRCVVKAIRKWRFPFTQKGGVTVELPLLFKPHDSQAAKPQVHTARHSKQTRRPGA